MLAFVDESGDSGRKILNRSSRYFVVAVVTFRNNDDAHACDAAIQRLHRGLNLHARYEFHYAENSLKIKEAFLRAVASQRFDYHVFALNKDHRKLIDAGVADEENLYRLAVLKAFENAKPYLDNATVVFDKNGERNSRNRIATYLRRSVTGEHGEQLIGKVRMQRSDGNNLLQLADYVVGVANRLLQGRQRESALWQRYLRSHEVSRVVWP